MLQYVMKLIATGFYILLSSVFIFYLVLPNYEFPIPPSDSIQSVEDADSESPLRRAYFTNFSREEVHEHYLNQFSLGFNLPTIKLTYPPEEAYSIIRDQTRSTHLPEFTHPFRESLYVNEFVPKDAKDDIWYKGNHYYQKITVKYAYTNVYSRLVVGLLTIIVGWFVMIRTIDGVTDFIKSVRGLKLPFFWT